MTTRLEKPIRRELEIVVAGKLFSRSTPMIVEISKAGVMLRQKSRRRRLVVSWRDVYELALERSLAERNRDRLRKEALDRHRNQLSILREARS